ncbi:unnamed protein product [Mortierella alpina]
MVFISRLATAALLFTSVLVNSAPVESLRSDLMNKVITRCIVPGTLAITFDDGPYKFTEELLNTLKANNAKATFFVNGDNYVQIQNPVYAKLIQRAKNEGHQIASHTWDHGDLATLGKDKILDEMNRLNKALKSIIGVSPTFVRPPYGSVNDLAVDTLKDAYTIVNWSDDTGDSAGKSWEESYKLYKELAAKSMQNRQAGPIVLQHDVYEKTALTLAPKAIALLKSKYRLVTVGTCLGVPEAKWYRS